jgi:alpha-L-arabinofuranosidase
MGNALACSRYQNMLHRYADLVEIANLSNMSTSFGGGQLQTGPGWIYKIPSYYTQGLYQRAAGSFPLKIDRSSAFSFYLREPDLDATLSPDRKTLRIYAVNSTSDVRKVRFHLPESLGFVETGEVLVVNDRNPHSDSEAMNSRDEANRIEVRTRKADFRGSEFGFGFAPFSVTLLELRLISKERLRNSGAPIEKP